MNKKTFLAILVSSSVTSVGANVINLSPAESKIQFQPKPWAGFGGIIVTISRQ